MLTSGLVDGKNRSSARTMAFVLRRVSTLSHPKIPATMPFGFSTGDCPSPGLSWSKPGDECIYSDYTLRV